jgi:Dolichyl-phosphate-mannose-protein mannosyltransferase
MNVKNLVSSPNKWEYLVPLLASVSLLISCAIASPKKYFWNDELLSYYLLTDPSLPHLMTAWGDTFNQSPPLYFILGWFWAKVFGSTDLSLRLFSSLAISVTLILVWIVLRHTYNFWLASIATLSVFAFSDLILYHNVEVRMYGLFSAVCTLGLLAFDTINRQEKPSRKQLLANSLIHGCIVTTHLYGLFYSGAILAAFIIRDRYFKLFRKNVYFSIGLGWLFLLVLLPTLINQSNNHAKWFSVVDIITFINYFVLSNKFSFFIFALILLSVFFYISHDSEPKNLATSKGVSEISLLILAGTFIGVPVLAWAITLTIKPMLNDRYIIPTIAISWPILLAYLSSRLFPNFILHRQEEKFSWNNLFINRHKIVFWILTAILIIHPIYHAKKLGYSSLKPGINDARYGYTDLPIAMEAGHDFLPRVHYSSNPNRYFHILDWETALKNTESAFATGDYTHLSALKRQYPEINTIQSQEFLKKYDRFLVLNEKDQKWFEWRIKNNPKYEVKSLGIADQGVWSPLELFLVKHKK